jgi:hypothetical protein
MLPHLVRPVQVDLDPLLAIVSILCNLRRRQQIEPAGPTAATDEQYLGVPPPSGLPRTSQPIFPTFAECHCNWEQDEARRLLLTRARIARRV